MERPIIKDLLTGEVLPYKSKEFYFSNLYCNRTNLIKHFKQISKEEIIEITSRLLSKRIATKSLNYGLSTVETQSLIFPSPALLSSLGVDITKINSNFGLINKYKYNFIDKKIKLIDKIIIDTREQHPLSFNEANVTIKKLPYGDYAYGNPDNSICIEKKEASDFIGTLSKGFERFCRELIRAEEAKSKMIIVVDTKLSNMLNFNYLPQFKWVKATPQFIFSRLRELLQSFPDVQTVFVNGKSESAKLTHFALSYGKDFLNYDIQHIINIGQLDKYIK